VGPSQHSLHEVTQGLHVPFSSVGQLGAVWQLANGQPDTSAGTVGVNALAPMYGHVAPNGQVIPYGHPDVAAVVTGSDANTLGIIMLKNTVSTITRLIIALKLFLTRFIM